MTSPAVTIRQGFSQIGRNLNMAIASLFSITAILLILGIFFIIIVNINNISDSVKKNFDEVQINLLDTTDEVAAQNMMAAFQGMTGVNDVSFLPRDEALDNWREEWGDNGDLLDRLESNPLPNAVVVKTDSLEAARSVVEKAKGMTGIEKINYAQDTVDKLINLSNYIQIGALILIAALLAISIVVVSNTIKLTVLAREKEITIMKYIGATNWFIRGPFLLEGVIIGGISSVVSSVIIGLLYHQVIENFGFDFTVLMSTGFVAERFLLENLVIIYAALGISIGACGSIISMRRFLDT